MGPSSTQVPLEGERPGDAGPAWRPPPCPTAPGKAALKSPGACPAPQAQLCSPGELGPRRSAVPRGGGGGSVGSRHYKRSGCEASMGSKMAAFVTQGTLIQRGRKTLGLPRPAPPFGRPGLDVLGLPGARGWGVQPSRGALGGSSPDLACFLSWEIF